MTSRPSSAGRGSASWSLRSLTMPWTRQRPLSFSNTTSLALAAAASSKSMRTRRAAGAAPPAASRSAARQHSAISSRLAVRSVRLAGTFPSRRSASRAARRRRSLSWPSAIRQRPSAWTAQTRLTQSSMAGWRISAPLPSAAGPPAPRPSQAAADRLTILLPRQSRLPGSRRPAEADRAAQSHRRRRRARPAGGRRCARP